MSILQTIDLKKYYGTEPNITRALDGVNFSVEDGEFVAVVGTSGSGKSTLLHMMGGLDTPTSGNVIVRDKELSKMNDEQLTIFRRRNIGFIFQNARMILFHKCHTTGGRADDVIVFPKQIVKTECQFHRFIFKTGICHRLSATSLIQRIIDVYSQTFQ